MTETTSEHEPRELPRRLGAFDATTLVIGSMIGSGVFLKAATIARRLPDPRLVLGVWLASGLLSFFGALVFAEVASLRPRSGGLYAVLHDELGPFAGFLFGWSLLAVLQTGSIAGLAAGIVERALAPSFGLSPSASTLVAGALVVLFSALNVVSVRAASSVQGVLTVAKCLGLLGLVFGAFVIAEGSSAHLVRVGAPADGESWVGAFGLAMIGALWAYDGWINVSFVAGELRQPQRQLPRALVFGTAFVTGLYVLANLAYHWVLPLAEVQAAKNPSRDLALRIVGAPGGVLLTVLVAVSSLGTLMSSVLSGPRVFFAMARDRLFPRALASVHPRFATPYLAIVLQCVWSLALLSRWRTFDALTDNVVFVYWIFYGLGAIAMLRARSRTPESPRPFRAPCYPLVPLAFLGGALFLTVNTVHASIAHGTSAALEALALLGAGAVLYPLFRTRS